MMRIGISKSLKADKAHELFDLMACVAEHTARDEAGLDIAPDGQPWKQVRILKNEAAFRTRANNCRRSNEDFTRIRRIQACFFFSSRRRHTRFDCDWSSDVCSSD